VSVSSRPELEFITIRCVHGYALYITAEDFCERHAPKPIALADKPLTRKEKRAFKRLEREQRRHG